MPSLIQQRIEAERDAANNYGAGCKCDKCSATRAATDEAVRKVEARIAELEKLAEYGKTFLITHGGAVVYASDLPEVVPSPYMGGCTCSGRGPSVPLYRDVMTHLDDCPAKDSGYPVGFIHYFSASEPEPHPVRSHIPGPSGPLPTTGGASDE